jgi:hypothetical protein
MGTIHHHVAVATVGWNYDKAAEAFARVIEFAKSKNEFLVSNYESLLIGPVDGVMNSYTSYLMVPDGSKEWWGTSDDCNEIRDYFVKEMNPHADVFVGSFGELSTTGVYVEQD